MHLCLLWQKEAGEVSWILAWNAITTHKHRRWLDSEYALAWTCQYCLFPSGWLLENGQNLGLRLIPVDCKSPSGNTRTGQPALFRATPSITYVIYIKTYVLSTSAIQNKRIQSGKGKLVRNQLWNDPGLSSIPAGESQLRAELVYFRLTITGAQQCEISNYFGYEDYKKCL